MLIMRKRPDIGPRSDPYDPYAYHFEGLNSYEIAMLFLTNSRITAFGRARLKIANFFRKIGFLFGMRTFFRSYGKFPDILTLTTKEAYTWASVITTLHSIYEITDEDIRYASFQATEEFSSKYLRPEEGYTSQFDPLSNLALEANSALLTGFIRYFESHESNEYKILHQSVDSTASAYKSLVEQDLIEDPFDIALGSIVLAVLGFIPYSFTTKTHRGEKKERDIKALFWEYRRIGDKHDKVIEFNFRLIKLIQSTIELNLRNLTKHLAQERK